MPWMTGAASALAWVPAVNGVHGSGRLRRHNTQGVALGYIRAAPLGLLGSGKMTWMTGAASALAWVPAVNGVHGSGRLRRHNTQGVALGYLGAAPLGLLCSGIMPWMTGAASALA
jgi:hypothetical protein